MSEELKSTALIAFSPVDRDKLNAMDKAGLIPPMAWGDGAFLAWLLANSSTIMALVKQIWEMFKSIPAPTPGPTPGPVA